MSRYARKIIIFVIFFGLLTAGTVWAALPGPTGYVSDFANVLDEQSKVYLENVIAGLEKKTGDEIAVVTVASLEEAPIEDYAVRLYEKWGIGKKGKDNGVLILVAPNDRKVRIEVGYGLEPVINDAMAGRIIREKMIPEFKQGNFAAGIVNGTVTTAAIIAETQGVEFNPASFGEAPVASSAAPVKKGPINTIFSVLFFILMAYLFIRHPWLFLFFLASSGRGGSSSRSGGFGGGGFGGFGGGTSGGGGASGSW